MASKRQRGRKQLLLALVVLTAIPAQAQTAPAAIGGSDSQDSWTMPADDRDTRPFTAPLNTREAAPQITITANRDTIIAGLEALVLTLAREGALQDRLTVTLNLTQEQEWIQILPFTVTFAAGQATAVDSIVPKGTAGNLQSGDVVVTLDTVAGYATEDATATVHVIALGGPAATAFVERSSYTFAEDDDDTRATVVARMASGMPRGADVRFTVVTFDGSAGFEDYQQIIRSVTLREESFVESNGRWEARRRIRLRLIDDDVREGVEYLRFFTALSVGDSEGVVVGDSTGAPCPDCDSRVEITDDEDIPVLDLSVAPETILEEDEESSTATVSITNGKTFTADQVVTFAFAGTAIEDVDYRVTPEDVADEILEHQLKLSVGSTSVAATVTAVDDDIEDSNEEIEVSATLEGEPIGSTQTIRILNQEVVPAITLAASRDTIIAGMERLVLTATREAPFDSPIAVTLQLTQEQDWLSRTSFQLNFAARGRTANLVLATSLFSSEVTESGNLTAMVDSVSGYDTGDATATVYVVSQAGPAMKVFFSHEAYRIREDREDAFVIVVAEAAAGMPRAATVDFSVSSRRGTARSPDDYEPLSVSITLPEEDFTLENGLWRLQHHLPLTLIDDDVREGTETFNLVLERAPSTPVELQLSDFLGAPCQNDCATPVEITDGEDIPVLELTVSEDEIREEDESSSTATVSITNGKTFAADQAVTLELGGDAIPGHDYHVTPADADQQAEGHQVTLSAGSGSVNATFAALDDDREEGDEKIRFSATHDGDAIGNGIIRIVDRFPGPKVEITFEGVRPPQDQYDAGIATGPFTTRITFSERVEGFTEEDIDWQTHSGTTVDTTNIGVLLWDYTEVRAGLEYTVKMMPDQNGRLHIVVFPGSARSVATGDGNQLGANSLQVRLPEGRMMVEPRALTVDEGDEDGAHFVVLLTSEPTGTVTVTVSGTEGTDVEVDWSTVTFRLPYWSGGWGVTVTASDDADARDETVTLRVEASGGGYDGKSTNVVVTVRDDDSASGDVDDEAAALILLEGVTPEAAAAALFGEQELSEARLDALDRLGNGNGRYDLGDLLSWIERCRQGEASCGAVSRDALPGAAMPIAGAARQGRRTRHRRRKSSGNRPLRRRSGPTWFGLVLLLAATMTWACADDVVQPPTEPNPGYLTVWLTVPPDVRDGGAMLLVEGPGIDSLQAPGFDLYESGGTSSRQIIVAGALSTGPVVQFRVPDRTDHPTQYRVRLLQVTGEDYSLGDPSAYKIAISRNPRTGTTQN